MPRAIALLAALLVCSPLAAAEIVTSEMPVADLHLAPDYWTYCSVHADTPKAFATCGKAGSLQVRYDLAADGKPILATRAPYTPNYNIVSAGDAQFYTETTGSSLYVRRAGSSAAARIEGVTTHANLTWNRRDELLATWIGGDKVMGAVVDTDLHIVAGPITIMTASSIWQIATAGGGFMIRGRSGVINEIPSAAVVDADGAVHPVALPTTFVSDDRIGGGDSDYLYVWQGHQQALLAQRYTASGDAAGGPTVIADAGTNFLRLYSIVWAGNDYLLSWQSGNFAWIRTLGGPPQMIDGGRGGEPTLVAGPAGLFLILRWSGGDKIRRLDTAGPEYQLSYGVVSQTVPAMAMDGPEAAVVWNETGEVRISRIGVDGTHLDGPGVVLPVDRTDATPSIAFDGVNYLVVWASGVRVNGVFFGRNGRIAGDAFVIAQELKTPDTPSVSWTGTQYVVTWRSSVMSQGAGATVTTSGVVTPIAYGVNVDTPTPGGGPRPIVVYATWAPTLPTYYSAIVGAFLDAAGEPFEITADTQNLSLRNVSQARVASNGRDYLATWVVKRGWYSEAWVGRVDDRGRRLGQPFVVSLVDRSSYKAQAIPLFDGTDYRVVVSGDASQPLFVARVDDAAFACGCLTDKIAVPLDFTLREQPRLFAAAASNDAIAIACERPFQNDATYGSETRVMIRFLRTPPPPRRRATK